jgi:hypothetical protein
MGGMVDSTLSLTVFSRSNSITGKPNVVPSSRRLCLRAVLGSAVRLARRVAALVIGERPVAV